MLDLDSGSLQWGRNFIVAEMISIDSITRSGLKRFNGAATLSLRKFLQLFVQLGRVIPLQWGRNFIVAEMSLNSRNTTVIT